MASTSPATITIESMPPEVVDRVGRLVHVGGNERDRHHQRDGRERQRDQEHRAPPEVAEQPARGEGPERGDGAADRRPQRDGRGARLTGPERGDERERGGVRHAGGDPPMIRANDQHLVGRSPRGEDARRDRQPDAQDQHQLAAVAVAERAEVEHRRSETERVPDRDQVERRLRGVERLADVGKRHVGDREVQVRDRGDQDQRERERSACAAELRQVARSVRCRIAGLPVTPRGHVTVVNGSNGRGA